MVNFCGGSSETPSWASEPCALGIDEAGRGPVIGPMVYACAITAVSSLDGLKHKKFADSKTLTEDQRESLYEAIAEDSTIAHAVQSITAKEISNQMLSRTKVSLNAMAETATCQLIDGALKAGYNLTQVFVDTVGHAGHYQERLSRKFSGMAFTVCPKADALYPIVSAASIVAKVTRDRDIKAFQQQLVQKAAAAAPGGTLPEGEVPPSAAVGSGYPGDPNTKAWLRSSSDTVFGYTDMVRFSWETCARLLEDVAVPVGWEEDEEGSGGKQMRLSFAPGASSAAESSGADRHSFFRVRKLQAVYEPLDELCVQRTGADALSARSPFSPRRSRRLSGRGVTA